MRAESVYECERQEKVIRVYERDREERVGENTLVRFRAMADWFIGMGVLVVWFEVVGRALLGTNKSEKKDLSELLERVENSMVEALGGNTWSCSARSLEEAVDEAVSQTNRVDAEFAECLGDCHRDQEADREDPIAEPEED